MKKIFSVLAICVLSLSMWSCKAKYYEKHQEVAKRDILSWEASDVKKFEVEIADTKPKFNLGVALRHHAKVVHSAVNVKVTTTAPSGKKTSKNVQVKLKDKDGKLVGEVAGDIVDAVSYVDKDFSFTETGKYTFDVALVSNMSLTGFMSVGFVIEKVEAK
jgi:gliding motility-associated lipoprotein GldH